jgi:hypothetical protein
LRIPNADMAIIPVEKLRGYLLSPAHPGGGSKAKFFANLGYTEVSWVTLEADLRAQHLSLEADEVPPTEHGRKFTITGPLAGPVGKSAVVISVWMIDRGEDVPRFLTAYPGKRR